MGPGITFTVLIVVGSQGPTSGLTLLISISFYFMIAIHIYPENRGSRFPQNTENNLSPDIHSIMPQVIVIFTNGSVPTYSIHVLLHFLPTSAQNM